jgi:hypothetical protein
MTPETEANLLTSIGSMLESVKNIKDDTKLLREVINGNGHPEEGMVYRLSMVEHTQRDCPISQVAIDVAEIKTNQKVSDAGNWLNRIWIWAKAKPQFSIPLTLAILSTMGFSIDKIVKALIMLREIGEKLGLRP